MCVQKPLAIIYDESKRQANIAKHGFDFAEFETAFGVDRFLIRPAKPSLAAPGESAFS